MKTTLLFVFAATASMLAQTNPTVSLNPANITTNYVASHPDFRIVNGQLYNTRKSQLWRNHPVKVLSRSGNITLARTYELRDEYETRWYPGTQISSWERNGGYAGPGGGGTAAGYRKTKIGTSIIYGRTLAFTNSGGLTIGDKITVMAMKVGKTASGSELWDCGTPQIGKILVTNAPATGNTPAKTK